MRAKKRPASLDPTLVILGRGSDTSGPPGLHLEGKKIHRIGKNPKKRTS